MNLYSKYIFSRVYELLNRNTFDTYRVSVHNPYTIFVELDTAIHKFQKKKIRNFDPTITHIGTEAKSFAAHPLTEGILNFGSFSVKQVEKILEDTCQKKTDGKRNRTFKLLAKTVILSNEKSFKGRLLAMIVSDSTDADMEKLETMKWLVEGGTQEIIWGEWFLYYAKKQLESNLINLQTIHCHLLFRYLDDFLQPESCIFANVFYLCILLWGT